MNLILSYSPNVDYSPDETAIEDLVLQYGKKTTLSESELSSLKALKFVLSKDSVCLRYKEYVLVSEGNNCLVFST